MYLLISMLNKVCKFIIYYNLVINTMKKRRVLHVNVLCYSDNYLILL